MKVKVVIEELICQEFEVEVNDADSAYDQIREMYKNGTLVVEDPTLESAYAMVCDDIDKETDWYQIV